MKDVEKEREKSEGLQKQLDEVGERLKKVSWEKEEAMSELGQLKARLGEKEKEMERMQGAVKEEVSKLKSAVSEKEKEFSECKDQRLVQTFDQYQSPTKARSNQSSPQYRTADKSKAACSVDKRLDDIYLQCLSRQQELKAKNQSLLNQLTRRFNRGDYRGEKMNNLRHGRGRQTYEDGTVYQGNWKDNKRNGYGALKSKEHDLYLGYWLNDKMHGCGNLKNPKYEMGPVSWRDLNSAKNCWTGYQGEFKHGVFEGYGIMSFSSGERFHGNFAKGKASGKG